MYTLAIDYCKTSQNLITFYTPHALGWAVIRAFSWHSVATMLSMVLRHEGLIDTPEARAARGRIDRLFQDRPEIEYLAGNDNLWEPLRVLRAELAAREGRVEGLPGAGVSAGEGETVSMTSTVVDPALFGVQMGGMGTGLQGVFEDWGDIRIWDNVNFGPYV